MTEPTVVGTRVCSKCGTEKPMTAFSPASWCTGGRRGQCKACRNGPGRATGAVEKTCTKCLATKPLDQFQARVSGIEGRHHLCRECRSAYRKSTYDSEAARISNRKQYAANREAMIAGVIRWQKANRDKRRDYEGRRRARRVATFVGPIETDKLCSDTCGICGKPIDPTLVSPHAGSKSLDHIIPLSLGGSHEQSNLQWSHLRCNIRKGNRPSI